MSGSARRHFPPSDAFNGPTAYYRKWTVVIDVDGTEQAEENRLLRRAGALARLAGVPLYRNPQTQTHLLADPVKRYRQFARMECWSEGWHRPDLHGASA